MSQTQETGGNKAESMDDLPPRVKPTPRSRGDLNMTSMIDVVFLLLIFFIVSTEFRIIEGLLPTNLPQKGSISPTDEPDPPLKEVRLILSNDRSPDLNPEWHSFTATISCPRLGRLPKPSECLVAGRSAKDVLRPLTLVTAGLKRLVKEHGGDLFRTKTPVVIQVDSDVEYGNVILVYDAVLGARMEMVRFEVKSVGG